MFLFSVVPQGLMGGLKENLDRHKNEQRWQPLPFILDWTGMVNNKGEGWPERHHDLEVNFTSLQHSLNCLRKAELFGKRRNYSKKKRQVM